MGMLAVDLTLPSPEANLALDEALLLSAEEAGRPLEVLRFWEAPAPLVVVGRSSRVDVEVNQDACRAAAVPILRRVTGGAAIVAGPGCLMYAVVLSLDLRPELRDLDAAHRVVLETTRTGLAPLVAGIERHGICDLTLDRRKFSGNSLRVKRTHLLYHGTLLYNFDLALIARLLRTPPRQPDYRQQRPHDAFVINLPTTRAALVTALRTVWRATNLPDTAIPHARTQSLITEKYERDDWNLAL